MSRIFRRCPRGLGAIVLSTLEAYYAGSTVRRASLGLSGLFPLPSVSDTRILRPSEVHRSRKLKGATHTMSSIGLMCICDQHRQKLRAL